MGMYLNPGNSGFLRITKKDYIDKTAMISVINSLIGSSDNLICISRPRRFGKSYAALMLCSYYDKSCDSQELFSNYAIAEKPDYKTHLNRYHVISLDVSGFISEAKKKNLPLKDIPYTIDRAILSEVLELYPNLRKSDNLNEVLLDLVNITGTQIVFIIDEWDSMIREAKEDDNAQDSYLNLLWGWFKNNNFTPKAVAAAYMTGILPIKKDGSQSAISDFREYTMLNPGPFAEYVGFTDNEVKTECKNKGQSFERMKKWYDGYTVGAEHSVYNPYSVMQALQSGKFSSYWKKTSAAETLMTYIDMDLEGLQSDIVRLIADEQIVVNTDSFKNDIENFSCKDDVLSLLIHLGYLSYEEVSASYDADDDKVIGVAKIPNEEVRTEFDAILRKAKHHNLVKLVMKSDRLLQDTLNCNADAVAKAIQDVHDSEYAPNFYNNEQSLRYVVKMAYISCMDQYSKLEELPSGRGIADIAFIPNRLSPLPAMIVELKWNKSSDGAIEQIKDKKYPKCLENYGGDIVLVGINYDEKTKSHSCNIERYSLI